MKSEGSRGMAKTPPEHRFFYLAGILPDVNKKRRANEL